MNDGRSLSGRATAAEPEVSALRDGIPSALSEPYWVTPVEDLGFHDFNREIVEPGANERFSDGCVGVRVDDDFWAVAALPLEKYRHVPIEDIVEELWPSIFPEAVFAPDSGTPEAEIHFLKGQVKSAEQRGNWLHRRLEEAEGQIAILTAKAMSAEGQDPQGLGAKPASAVAESHLPDSSMDKGAEHG